LGGGGGKRARMQIGKNPEKTTQKPAMNQVGAEKNIFQKRKVEGRIA